MLDLKKADGDLSNKGLRALVKWKPGPRGGASQYSNPEARRAAWATLKDAPTPEPEGEEAPLPYAEELALLVQGPSMGAAASSAKRAMEDAAETGPHVPGHTREPWCFFGGRAWP